MQKLELFAVVFVGIVGVGYAAMPAFRARVRPAMTIALASTTAKTSAQLAPPPQAQPTPSERAWGLFTSAISGTNPWYTWSTKCYQAGVDESKSGVYLTRLCQQLVEKNVDPEIASAVLSSGQQSVDGSHLASVFFNDIATQSIVGNRFSLPRMESQPDPIGSGAGSDISFAKDSTIVKAIWETVRKDPATKEWRIKVYDPSKPACMTAHIPCMDQLKTIFGTFLHPGDWQTEVVLDPGKERCAGSDGLPLKDIPIPIPGGGPAPIVPIGCFYRKLIQPTNKVAPYLQKIGLPPNEPYYLVLVGLHIAHKETETSWSWTTFWWTNRPTYQDGVIVQNPPASLPDNYSHFAMNTTISPASGTVHNPYLEGTEKQGMASDCRSCHALAAIRPNVATKQDFGLPGAPPLPANYWTNAIGTDHIWSIATARNGLLPHGVDAPLEVILPNLDGKSAAKSKPFWTLPKS